MIKAATDSRCCLVCLLSCALLRGQDDEIQDQSQYKASEGCPQIGSGINHLVLLNEIDDHADNGNEERENEADDSRFFNLRIIVVFHIAKIRLEMNKS